MLTWSTNEIADILGVAVGSVRMWIHRNQLKAVKVCNSEGNRIRETSLLEFLNEHPKYRQIFLDKLANSSTIGNKNSKEVQNYLQRKGYLA